MSPHPVGFDTPEHIGVWVGALLTLCVFSFLYKDNPFYRFAEHLFVGVSAGYVIILRFWTVIVTNLWNPLLLAFKGSGVNPANHGMFAAEQGDYRGWLLIPGLLGLMLFTRLFSRISWVSRWSLALIIGVYAGLKTTGAAQADFVAQVQASLQPLWVPGHTAGLGERGDLHGWADHVAAVLLLQSRAQGRLGSGVEGRHLLPDGVVGAGLWIHGDVARIAADRTLPVPARGLAGAAMRSRAPSAR
jgi:hypothetical protein